MAERNLSVTVLMFLMEASSRVRTSSWLIACSGVTSYGNLLQNRITRSLQHYVAGHLALHFIFASGLIKLTSVFTYSLHVLKIH